MHGHREPDRADGVAVIVQVEGRRRRGPDHHELAHHQRAVRDDHAGLAQDHAGLATALGGARRACRLDLSRDRERIGSQERLHQDRRERVADDGDQKRARDPRHAQHRADADRRRHQHRADDRADRRAPDDQPHRAAALRARADVRRGVPREQVGRLRGAEQRHARQEEDEALLHDADHSERGARDGERVADRESQAPSRPCHEP